MMSNDEQNVVGGIIIGFFFGMAIMMLVSGQRERRLMEEYGIEIEYEEPHYEEVWHY